MTLQANYRLGERAKRGYLGKISAFENDVLATKDKELKIPPRPQIYFSTNSRDGAVRRSLSYAKAIVRSQENS